MAKHKIQRLAERVLASADRYSREVLDIRVVVYEHENPALYADLFTVERTWQPQEWVMLAKEILTPIAKGVLQEKGIEPRTYTWYNTKIEHAHDGLHRPYIWIGAGLGIERQLSH